MYQESQELRMNVKDDLNTMNFYNVNYTINRMDMRPSGMTQLIVLLVFSSIIIYIILIRPNKQIQLQLYHFDVITL